jgi:hypothetical protein
MARPKLQKSNLAPIAPAFKEELTAAAKDMHLI